MATYYILYDLSQGKTYQDSGSTVLFTTKLEANDTGKRMKSLEPWSAWIIIPFPIKQI